MSFEITGLDAMIAVLAKAPGLMEKVVVAKMRDAMIQLERHVKQNKLTGQVLHVRTGNLRNSIHPNVESNGKTVVGTARTDVKYGVFWEFGGIVPQHNRLVTKVFGHELKFPVWGTWKERTVAPRSFIGSGMQDLLPLFQQKLGTAVIAEVLRK